MCPIIFRLNFFENLKWYLDHIIYTNVYRRTINLHSEAKETELWNMWKDFWDSRYVELP